MQKKNIEKFATLCYYFYRSKIWLFFLTKGDCYEQKNFSIYLMVSLMVSSIPVSAMSHMEDVDVYATQAMIDSGYLEMDSNGNLFITAKYQEWVEKKAKELGKKVVVNQNEIIFYDSEITYASNGGGVTKIVWALVGSDVYLSSEDAERIAIATSTAGGIASLLIPDPIISRALGTALILAAGLIAYNNTAKTGVIISFAFIPAPIPTFNLIWIRPQ